MKKETFIHAVRVSTEMTAEQKAYWEQVIKQERAEQRKKTQQLKRSA